MPRINIDTEFFGDPRIEATANASGMSLYEARGRLLTLWNFCYCQIRSDLSHKEALIHSGGHADFIKNATEFGLIDQTESGYRVKGTEKRFGYLIKCREAGKRSAESRKQKYGSSNPRSNKSDEVENPTGSSPEGTFTNSGTSQELLPLALALDLDKTSSKEDVSISGEIGPAPKPKKSDSGKADPSPDLAARPLFDLWNSIRGDVSPCVRLTAGLRTKIQTRLKDKRDLAYWDKIFRYLNQTPFYNGENDRGWVADLNFILHNQDRHVRIAGKIRADHFRKGKEVDVFEQARKETIARREQKEQRRREIARDDHNNTPAG